MGLCYKLHSNSFITSYNLYQDNNFLIGCHSTSHRDVSIKTSNFFKLINNKTQYEKLLETKDTELTSSQQKKKTTLRIEKNLFSGQINNFFHSNHSI